MDVVINYYNNDQLFKAYKEYQNLRSSSPAILGDAHFAPFIVRLEREYQLAKELHSDISCNGGENGWVLVHETAEIPETQSTIKTYYRQSKDSPLHALKIEAILPCSMFSLLSMFYEIDLYKTWVPRMTESRILHEFPIHKYRFLTYYKFNLFWPMDDRDLICYGYGIDVLEEYNGVLVVVYSLDDDEDLGVHMKQYTEGLLDRLYNIGDNATTQNDTVPVAAAVMSNSTAPDASSIKPPKQSGTTRMSCNMSGFFLEYISETQTRVRLLGQADPKMQYVPSWLINAASNQFAHKCMTYLSNLAKGIETDEGQWKQRLQKQVYQDLRARLGKK